MYPNPTADGGATIAYKLAASRMLNLSLFDLSGTKPADLASNVRRGTGDGQIAFTLNNIPSGMYLVILTTDKNERVVHRLIAQ
ncbi:MAG: T9SS type A sorting domain-containing protein [Ignavibacteria bacterium]|nr:T9SS type A sorting domain-containing protein [Ignavibacteria bacterium]